MLPEKAFVGSCPSYHSWFFNNLYLDQINIIKSLSFFFINGLHDLLVAHVLVAAFHILFYFVVGIIEEGFQTNSLFLFFKGAQYLFSILQN